MPARPCTHFEFEELFKIIGRDLADSETAGLSADWKLGIAYNAALPAAAAALAAAGYRDAREQHHDQVIQSLALTVAAGSGFTPTLSMRFERREPWWIGTSLRRFGRRGP